VSRADLAAESERYLIAHLIMRWRWPGRMLDRDESHYWTMQAGRQRPSNRDTLLYASKPSKVAAAPHRSSPVDHVPLTAPQHARHRYR
jgi:hypothetical protein